MRRAMTRDWVAFSCKKRGFCGSCGARRMADSAALLVDEILPHQPMRQWVLSVPFPLRLLFARQPAVMGKVLGIVYRTIATHLTHKAGYTKATAKTGAVTLIQCFGGALNLNIHYHSLFLDGVYINNANTSRLRFRWVMAPTNDELTHLTHTIAHRVARYLERQGLLERDAGHTYLTADGVDEDAEITNESTTGKFYYLPYCRGATTRPQGIYAANPAGRIK